MKAQNPMPPKKLKNLNGKVLQLVY